MITATLKSWHVDINPLICILCKVSGLLRNNLLIILFHRLVVWEEYD